MDKRYAREKLTLLLRDLDSYADDEFWRQMSRIAAGATGEDHAEEIEKERDSLAAHVERLRLAWVDAKRCVSVVAFPSLYRVENYQGLAKASIKKIEAAMKEAPATSLAELKAESRAEGMHRALCILESEFDPCHPIIERLEQIEAEERRQAEGGSE